MEPSHPRFPSLELFCKIHDIDLYFSDYVMANLMNIQKSLAPPPPDAESPDKHAGRRDKGEVSPALKLEEEIKKARVVKKTGRNFEESDEEDRKADPADEDDDGNVDEGNLSGREINTLSLKSKSDIESFAESSRASVHGHRAKVLQGCCWLRFVARFGLSVGVTEAVNLAVRTA